MPIKDGDHITVSGKLSVEFRGWSSYAMIHSDRPFRADFGDGANLKTSDLQVIATGVWDQLKSHPNGEAVSITGKVQTEDASPYYFNGVAINATDIKLADGRSLTIGDALRAIVPQETNEYLVTVRMIPNQIEWPRSAVDVASGKLFPASSVLDGCGLNGGGDVLNCYCADDFVPVRAGVVQHAHSIKNITAIPKAYYALKDMAQFGLPDEDATRPLMYQVVCKRKVTP